MDDKMNEKTQHAQMDDATSTSTYDEKATAKEGNSTREATRSPSPARSERTLHEAERTTTQTDIHKVMSVKEAQAELSRVMTSGEGIEYPKGIKLTLISIALCLSVFLMALDNTIIATAIPKITDQFHSLPDVGWYGSALVPPVYLSYPIY